ncbi:MAG: Rpn family recombination-promoting nuclease/putative transposase [Ruminococcus sp.]|jgi:predicted transposase/invertase (TIGR01784 family)|nr:Rpn family recombination-promoting nuclease/putative transposase [Ruminococcus sp.]
MNEELIVKPKNDVVFKTLFVKHTDLLIDFLSYALNMKKEEIANIRITNPEIMPEKYGDKFVRLDLVLLCSDGTKINVEMQNSDEGNYKERSVYNCSKMYIKDVSAGDEYADISKTVCINIVQFPLFTNAGCVCTIYPTIQETGETVTDKWKIIYFQTKKLPKDEKGGLWDWLKFFTISTEKELDIMENTLTGGVKQAVCVIRQMNADEEMQEIARMREKAKMAEYSALKKAKGEGLLEKAISTAKNLISYGVPIDIIAKSTGLSDDEVKKIQSEQ